MSRKRQRAIITQDSQELISQADEADEDLVGMEQAIIGGDRSTAGIRLKGTIMPAKPGIYKGGFNIRERVLSRLADQIAVPVDINLLQTDLNIVQDAGGYQMVFDSQVYLVRTVTGSTNLGLDTWTTNSNPVMITAKKNIFQKIYNKLGTDAPQYTNNAVNSTSHAETTMPGLYVSNYVNTKTLNNTGSNTIVLELWDFLCIEDTSLSPCQAWAKDLYAGNYGSDFPGTQLTPTTEAAMNKSWGDPGVRPKQKRDKTLFDFWKCIRITRYLVRSGQSIHHVTTIPSTEISHTKLYGYGNDGSNVEAHVYLSSLSIETMAFAIGELCFDETSGSQAICSSSVFLQGRGSIELTARTLPRVRTRYNFNSDYSLSDNTSRMAYYPSIPTANQAVLSQAQPGQYIDVQNFDTADLNTVL